MKERESDPEMPVDPSDSGISTKERRVSRMFFAILLLMYTVASVETMFASRSGAHFIFMGAEIPLSMLTGVLSSLANILLIFLVIYFGKPGFITAVSVLALQFPMIVFSFTVSRNPAILSGLFTNIFTLIAIILIYQRNRKIEKFQDAEIDHLKEQQNLSQRLFEQTATALVNAIDAKDKYSHGHSMRVAEYSEKIAREMGKSDEECYQIYYSALLHDVGKIGIRIDILNKKGKLTDEEYENVKLHPVFGNQILSSISEYPYLSIGAHYHHERYDGKGYPEKLKGEDIPEIARIISVADAYDAMTSKRSYRDAIPQQLVREEIVKNAGTQFDPEIAKIMQKIIDRDVEYEMKEKETVKELAGKNVLHCGEYRAEISDGIIIIPAVTKMRMKCAPEGDANGMPSMILFDSLDGRVHKEEKTKEDLCYYEFAEIRFDGETVCRGARKVKVDIDGVEQGVDTGLQEKEYVIEAVRCKDHALIKIDDGSKMVTVTVALPDSSRYTYIGLTGENCRISDVAISKSKDWVSEDYIPRIAEKISYIEGPQGDVPNVQIDGHRTESTAGIPITDGLEISFHTMSLPTSRLIWHCPFIEIFHSRDGSVNGKDYRDYALVRLDGETWKGEGESDDQLTIEKTDEFKSWEDWKSYNRKGYDCTVRFGRQGNVITVDTVNYGIVIHNVTTVLDGKNDIYAALSGDQCALTGIRISK